jgi:hypothetical protein
MAHPKDAPTIRKDAAQPSSVNVQENPSIWTFAKVAGVIVEMIRLILRTDSVPELRWPHQCIHHDEQADAASVSSLQKLPLFGALLDPSAFLQ